MKRKFGSKEKFIATADQIKDANSSKSLQECLDSLPLDAAKKITASAVQDDDGGTPYIETVNGQQSISLIFHNFKGNDGQDGQNGQDGQDGVTGATGATGPQGATGVYDSTTQNFLITLETTIGQDQTKTMTQKAITDELINTQKKFCEWQDIYTGDLQNCMMASSGDWYWVNTQSSEHYQKQRHSVVEVTPTSILHMGS